MSTTCPFCKSEPLNGIRTHTLHCTRLRPIVSYNYPGLHTRYIQALSMQDARLIATHCVYDACEGYGIRDTKAAHDANNKALTLPRGQVLGIYDTAVMILIS